MESIYVQFLRIQMENGSQAAIEFANNLDVQSREDLSMMQELILNDLLNDASLETTAIKDVLNRWRIRKDWKLVFGARLAAIEQDLQSLAKNYYGYVELMNSSDPPDIFHIASAAWHFGIAFQLVGDFDAARASYRQCLNIFGDIEHIDCKRRLSQLERDRDPKPEQSQREDISDPFTILEISPKATASEVKIAYHEMVGKYHPDRVADLGLDLQNVAEEKSKQINWAYNEIKKIRSRVA
jgi:hypothetical protein